MAGVRHVAVMLVLAFGVGWSAVAAAQADIDLDDTGSGKGSGAAPAKPPPPKPPTPAATPPAAPPPAPTPPKPPAPAATSPTPAPTPPSPGAGTGSGVADATPPVKDPKVAKQYLTAAQQLVQRGNTLAKSKPDDAKLQYENAVIAFNHAIEAGDDVNVYFQLGQVEEKLTALAAAYRAYRTVTTATTGAQPAIVKQAKARLDDLATKVGIVTLTITPDDTTVEIDHDPVGTTPLKEPLVLMPGTYTLSLTAVSGFQPKEVPLQVDPGSETDRKIDLDPIPVTVVQSQVHDQEPPAAPPPGPPSKLPIFIGAGATAAFGITTIVTGALALHQHSLFVARDTDPQTRYDAQINGPKLADASDGFLIATVVAAGFTAGWYFWEYRRGPATPTDELHNPNAPKLEFIPWVQPDGGGLFAHGAF